MQLWGVFLYNVMQNIHSATKDFEAVQRAEREAFIQVLKLLKSIKILVHVFFEGLRNIGLTRKC